MYPTETVYGLGVNAINHNAVSTLLAVKNRPAGKPVSVLVADSKAAERIVDIDAAGMSTVKSLLPGPYTLIFKEADCIDPRLVSEMGTAGIRISSHPFANLLANEVDFPITATSANASGAARPYSVEEALATFPNHLREQIDLIIDAGELPKAEPSTVIDLSGPSQQYVRVGSGIPSPETVVVTVPEEMVALASRLTQGLLHGLAYHPIFFLLEGDLGVGKTQFTKGIAAALGLPSTVSSPSYTLVKEYGEVPKRLVHMDLWRTPSVTAEEVGLPEYAHPGTLIAVEWPQPLEQWLSAEPRFGLRIGIEGEDSRTVTVNAL